MLPGGSEVEENRFPVFRVLRVIPRISLDQLPRLPGSSDVEQNRLQCSASLRVLPRMAIGQLPWMVDPQYPRIGGASPECAGVRVV